MTLSEFIRKRLEELGHNRSWLVNHGDLDWSTLSNIDKGLSIRKGTQEKLAKALECTQGDIQKCMAEVPNPLREEAARPEGNAGISITAKAKRKPKPVAPAPDPKDEEPAEVFQPEPEVDMMFPVEEPEEPKETLAEFKARLTQMVFREMLVTESSLTSIVLQNIGKKLVKELIGGNEE